MDEKSNPELFEKAVEAGFIAAMARRGNSTVTWAQAAKDGAQSGWRKWGTHTLTDPDFGTSVGNDDHAAFRKGFLEVWDTEDSIKRVSKEAHTFLGLVVNSDIELLDPPYRDEAYSLARKVETPTKEALDEVSEFLGRLPLPSSLRDDRDILQAHLRTLG